MEILEKKLRITKEQVSANGSFNAAAAGLTFLETTSSNELAGHDFKNGDCLAFAEAVRKILDIPLETFVWKMVDGGGLLIDSTAGKPLIVFPTMIDIVLGKSVNYGRDVVGRCNRWAYCDGKLKYILESV